MTDPDTRLPPAPRIVLAPKPPEEPPPLKSVIRVVPGEPGDIRDYPPILFGGP